MSVEAATHGLNWLDNKADSGLSTLKASAVQKSNREWTRIDVKEGFKPQMNADLRRFRGPNPTAIYWAQRRVQGYRPDEVFALIAG